VNAVRIDNSGNVGIGTTGPGYKLHTYGATPDIKIEGTGSLSQLYFSNTAKNWVIGHDSTNGFFAYDGAYRFFIQDSTGNVGIGTTGPTQKLQIATGNILLDNTYGLRGKTVAGNDRVMLRSGSDDSIVIGASAATSWSGGISFVPENTTAMTISTGGNVVTAGNLTVQGTGNSSIAGNVGIGTTAPGTTLDVDGYVMADQYWIGADSTTRIGNPAAAESIGFFTSNTEAVRIDSAGYVGILDTTPSYPLDVNGDARIADHLGVNAAPSTTTIIYATETLTDPSATSTAVTGGNTTVTTANVTRYLYGLYGYAIASPSVGSVNSGGAYGITGLARMNSESRELANLRGGSFTVDDEAAGSVTNITGLYITMNADQISASNSYGLVLGGTGDGGAANSYGIYQTVGNKNYFADKVGIGTTTPTAILDIRATGASYSFTAYDDGGNQVLLLDDSASPVKWEQTLYSQFIQGSFYQTAASNEGAKDDVLLAKDASGNYYSSGTYTSAIFAYNEMTDEFLILKVNTTYIDTTKQSLFAQVQVSDDNFATIKDSIDLELTGDVQELDISSLANAKYVRVKLDFQTQDPSITPRLAWFEVWANLPESAQNLSELNANGTASDAGTASTSVAETIGAETDINFLQALSAGLEKLGLILKDGIATLKELIVEKITAKKLCLEENGETVCLDKNQLKQLLNATQQDPPASTPAPLPSSEPTQPPPTEPDINQEETVPPAENQPETDNQTEAPAAPEPEQETEPVASASETLISEPVSEIPASVPEPPVSDSTTETTASTNE
jgi:hypothetical protein